MTIEKGDSPQNDGSNKFIAKNGDGHRGTLIAISPDGKEGIIDGITRGFGGSRILVKEVNAKEYPRFVRNTSTIPDGFKSV